MKKIVLFFSIIAFSLSVSAQTAFTPGTVSIYRAGDGVAALVNTGNQVFVDEYTTATPAVLVRSVALPTAPAGPNGSLVSAGSSTSEGLLTRSSDGTVLLATGYNATLPNAVVLTSSASATINRSVGVIKADGSVDITTKLSDFATGSSPRSAISNNNGGNLWVGGGAGGVRYAILGATTSTQINTTVPVFNNIRQLNIFNGNLYFSTGSAPIGIYQVGTGLPNTAPQVNTNIINTTTSGIGTASPYSFVFNAAGDVAYIADDRSIANGGGIQKWTLSGGVWSLAYILSTGASGARGLTVDFTIPASPVLYATTAEGTANRLYQVIDAGVGSVGTTIATAPALTAFRGVAFSPQAAVVPVNFISFATSFTGTGIALKWVTANENDISGYTVQKSNDGRTFEDVSTIAARNNSIGGEYNFNYTGKSSTALYFRIKASELSGRVFYTNILKAENKAGGNLNVYPTTTAANITVQYNTANEQGNLVIVNMAGKEVFRKDVSSNITAETISVQLLQAGAYIIKYSTKSGSVQTGRFIKQ